MPIYKSGRGIELGAIENNSSLRLEQDLNPGPLDFEAGTLVTCDQAEF